MTEEEKKFIEIRQLFKRMSDMICSVVESYHIWRTLTFSRSTPEMGQEQADKNAKLLNSYKYFFMPTMQSHLETFIIGLMKFFDKDHRALSFDNLIKEIEKNKKSFTPAVLKKVHPKLAEIGVIEPTYVPINQTTIDHIQALRQKHKKLIESLKDIRDKRFAHNDLVSMEGTFVPNEVEELITAVQEMFNKLSGTFDLSSTIWSHIKEDTINETKFLLENLERGDIQRREEIMRKFS